VACATWLSAETQCEAMRRRLEIVDGGVGRPAMGLRIDGVVSNELGMAVPQRQT
jgi:hypothetical protein